MLFGNKGKAVADKEASEGVDSSLALIEPDVPVELLMRPAEETYGKLKPRVVFRLAGSRYELNLTDFEVSEAIRQAGCGSYSPQKLGLDSKHTLLCVSLGGAHNGWHTKLAAAALFLPG